MVMTMMMANLFKLVSLCALYFLSPFLRRSDRNRIVETPAVATTPIAPAAPVDRRGFSTPLTP
jgi:hypothetical protein